jgi:hypothetical protein
MLPILRVRKLQHTETKKNFGGLLLRLEVIQMQKCALSKQIGLGLQVIYVTSEVQYCIIYFAAEAYQVSRTSLVMRLIHQSASAQQCKTTGLK